MLSDYNLDLQTKKNSHEAYCSSEVCNKAFRGKRNYQYKALGILKTIKDKSISDCPDCGSTLFWKYNKSS